MVVSSSGELSTRILMLESATVVQHAPGMRVSLLASAVATTCDASALAAASSQGPRLCLGRSLRRRSTDPELPARSGRGLVANRMSQPKGC